MLHDGPFLEQDHLHALCPTKGLELLGANLLGADLLREGLEAGAFLDGTVHRYGLRGEHVKIELWDQSIGAGVATTAGSTPLGLEGYWNQRSRTQWTYPGNPFHQRPRHVGN